MSWCVLLIKRLFKTTTKVVRTWIRHQFKLFPLICVWKLAIIISHGKGNLSISLSLVGPWTIFSILKMLLYCINELCLRSLQYAVCIATMCLNSKIIKANRTSAWKNLEYDLIVVPNENTYTFLEILLPELIHFPCLPVSHSTFSLSLTQ